VVLLLLLAVSCAPQCAATAAQEGGGTAAAGPQARSAAPHFAKVGESGVRSGVRARSVQVSAPRALNLAAVHTDDSEHGHLTLSYDFNGLVDYFIDADADVQIAVIECQEGGDMLVHFTVPQPTGSDSWIGKIIGGGPQWGCSALQASHSVGFLRRITSVEPQDAGGVGTTLLFATARSYVHHMYDSSDIFFRWHPNTTMNDSPAAARRRLLDCENLENTKTVGLHAALIYCQIVKQWGVNYDFDARAAANSAIAIAGDAIVCSNCFMYMELGVSLEVRVGLSTDGLHFRKLETKLWGDAGVNIAIGVHGIQADQADMAWSTIIPSVSLPSLSLPLLEGFSVDLDFAVSMDAAYTSSGVRVEMNAGLGYNAAGALAFTAGYHNERTSTNGCECAGQCGGVPPWCYTFGTVPAHNGMPQVSSCSRPDGTYNDDDANGGQTFHNDRWDWCDPQAATSPGFTSSRSFSYSSAYTPPYGFDNIALTHGGTLVVAIKPTLVVTVQGMVPITMGTIVRVQVEIADPSTGSAPANCDSNAVSMSTSFAADLAASIGPIELTLSLPVVGTTDFGQVAGVSNFPTYQIVPDTPCSVCPTCLPLGGPPHHRALHLHPRRRRRRWLAA
jgi:hypothetical protein